MSMKRTSAESNEGSDSVSQQEDNAKRAKLASPSDTTLQDLPIEVIENILIKVVTMEVMDAKLVKSAWKEKADLVIDSLATVCSQWHSILTTKTFRNKVHRILEGTAQEPLRLEVLRKSPLDIFALDVTTMKDEMFVLWRTDYEDYSINVYDSNNMGAVKHVIPLPGINPLSVVACSVSNCVYILDRKQGFQVSILRITKDDKHQFYISAMLRDLLLPNPALYVTTTGGLILSTQQREDSAVISTYDANGSFQQEISLPSEISRLSHIIPKSNGNLVLVSRQKGQYRTKLTEIDLNGTILRQYLPPVIGGLHVSRADISGRMVMTELRPNRISLMDPEFNLMEYTGPHHKQKFPYVLHYDSERNEVVSFFDSETWKGVLTRILILSFKEE